MGEYANGPGGKGNRVVKRASWKKKAKARTHTSNLAPFRPSCDLILRPTFDPFLLQVPMLDTWLEGMHLL